MIAQLADNIRTQRAANGNDGRLLSGLGNGGGIANGRLRGVVQNIVSGMVQNQPLNGNTNANAINVRYSNPDARSKARVPDAG